MPSLYKRYEPRNGHMAWHVVRVALVQGGLTSGRAGDTLVRSPVGHTEEIRRNRRRKVHCCSWCCRMIFLHTLFTSDLHLSREE
jgi:hypothetical protein